MIHKKCLNVYPKLFVYKILWLTITFTFSHPYVPTSASTSHWTPAQSFIVVLCWYTEFEGTCAFKCSLTSLKTTRKQLSHTNSLIMITRRLYLQMLYKMQSINMFKQSQVFRSTLYFHEVQKLASVPYSSLSHWKPWSYFHCCQINKICFHKYDNHKTIEILCYKSDNLKTK